MKNAIGGETSIQYFKEGSFSIFDNNVPKNIKAISQINNILNDSSSVKRIRFAALFLLLVIRMTYSYFPVAITPISVVTEVTIANRPNSDGKNSLESIG